MSAQAIKPAADNERLIGITFKTNARIAKELARRALEGGVTQRCILHEGLKALGLDIREEDLVDKRGRPPKMAKAAKVEMSPKAEAPSEPAAPSKAI